MRRGGFTACLALAGVLTGCRPDPIIGKWRARGPVSTRTLIFRADGSASLDPGTLTVALKKAGKNERLRKELEKSLAALRATRTTWERAGALYEIRTQIPGKAPEAPGYARVEGDHLHLCRADGTSIGITLSRSP